MCYKNQLIIKCIVSVLFGRADFEEQHSINLPYTCISNNGKKIEKVKIARCIECSKYFIILQCMLTLHMHNIQEYTDIPHNIMHHFVISEFLLSFLHPSERSDLKDNVVYMRTVAEL